MSAGDSTGAGLLEAGAETRRIGGALTRLVRRVRIALFVVELLRWGALGALATGCVVLFLRAALAIEPPRELALATPLAVGLAAALARLARGGGFDRAAAATWLDAELGGSGAFVTHFELADPRWSARFAARLDARDAADALHPAPRVGQPLGLAAAAFAFLAAALWVDVPRPRPGPSPELVEALVAALGDKLDLLNETIGVDEELAEDLSARLERLEGLTEDLSPESLFEAIDALDARLGDEAERFGLDMAAAREELARVAVDLARDPVAAWGSAQRALELARAAGLELELPPELAALFAEGRGLAEGATLDPAKLLEMGLGLSRFLETPLGKLAQAGLLDPSRLQEAVPLEQLFELVTDGHACDESCASGGG